MKLLLDQNLSRHLVRHLRDVFPESEHVSDLGLDGATDEEIWEYAREHGGVNDPGEPPGRSDRQRHAIHPPVPALDLLGGVQGAKLLTTLIRGARSPSRSALSPSGRELCRPN